MKQLTLCLCGLLASFMAVAKPVLTVNCGEPSGSRYDQIESKIKQQVDGFAGANPLFVWDDSKPKSLMVVWGIAKWAKDAGLPSNAEEATIVFSSEDMISAVMVDELGAVKMYSLFPGKHLVYFTQHRYLNAMGGVPNTSSFYASCAFTSK